MKKIGLIITLLLAFCTVAVAQVVTTSPEFPVDGSDAVTIYFHASEGDGGLEDFTGDVYVHTGVVLEGVSGWSHVVTTWGTADDDWKMTSLGDNEYSFTISDLRSWYGVASGEIVDSIAILFRNADGTQVGRNTGGADIFIKVIQPDEMTGHFTLPSVMPYYKAAASTLTTTFVTSESADISLYENGTLNSSVTSATTISASLTGTTGVNWVKAVATNGETTVTDSFYYVNIPATVTEEVPAGMHDGVNYTDDNTATLVLTAPGKNYVCVAGDFNNWVTGASYFMKKSPDGKRWWLKLSGLTAHHQYAYQYVVDGAIKIADPYAELVLDPDNDPYIDASVYPDMPAYPAGKTTGIVSVLQTAKTPYSWTATDYVKPEKKNLMIYELLVRDFIAGHNYQQLIDTLPYLKRLGINAIELMPFNEFEGNISWGYNPSFYFSPDKYYGSATMLKSFIDACHEQDIAVIMDMVLNHSFSQSPMCKLYWDAANGWPSADNPWYNTDCNPTAPGYQGKHPYGVGFDFNHESSYTKKFFADVVHYWVNEYKIDGYRFDLSKGFTQNYTGDDVSAWGNYDASRVAIWKSYADSIWSGDTSTYIILEHFAANSEETELADYGMMLWGNHNYNYAQSAMGYVTSDGDITNMSYVNRGWDEANLVGYMESHDEERVLYKCLQYGNSSGSYNIKNLNTALSRVKMNATFFFTIPGPKMLWQFEELGYDSSINSGGDRTAPKAMLWDYYNIAARKAVYQNFRSLLYLRNTYPDAFNTTDFTMNTGNMPLRSIYLNDASMQVAALGNFGVTSGTISASFPHTGWWYNYFTGDSLHITTTPQNINLQAGEYRLYLSQRITPPDGVTAVANLNKDENKAHLFQNYPNPFSDISTMQFYLPVSTEARLELFDLSGRSIDVIADKRFDSGTYSFELSAGNLTGGVYLVTLTVNGHKESIGVSVVK